MHAISQILRDVGISKKASFGENIHEESVFISHDRLGNADIIGGGPREACMIRLKKYKVYFAMLYCNRKNGMNT